MPEILGIIPARADSKRLPGKNKRLFKGKPLVEHIIATAISSTKLSQLVISTDDEEIIEITKRYPNVQFIKRPKKLATDDSPAIDYVNHALKLLENENRRFDYIVILQPTSPLTLAEDIDQTIESLLRSKSADSSVSIVKLDHAINPIKMKTMHDQILHPFLEEEKGRMAEKDVPAVYVRNCSVYVSKRSVINSGKIIGDTCIGYLMPRERSIDINDEVDFAFAEFLYERNQNQKI